MKRKKSPIDFGHIKKNTKGTSNEISFSVLDAAKNDLEEDSKKEKRFSGLGVISLFSLPLRKKKASSTPSQEKGLHLSSGGFVSVEDGSDASSTPAVVVPSTTLNDAAAANSSSAAPVITSLDGSQGTSTSQKGSTWTLPADEVARNKAARRRRKAMVVVPLAVVLVAICYFGLSWFNNAMQLSQDNKTQLDRSIALLKEVDSTMLDFDAMVMQRCSSAEIQDYEDLSSSYEQVQFSFDATEMKLEESARYAQKALEGFEEGVKAETASKAHIAATKRLEMLECGQAVMADALARSEAASYAEKGWELLLKADDNARAAASLVSDPTDQNVKDSTDKTNQAIAQLNQADQAFSDAEYLYPNADYSVYHAYIAKRIEALEHAVASNNALLNKKADAAASENDKYTKTDAEAAKLAEDLPADPTSPILEAVPDGFDEMVSSYEDARTAAATADSFIREYLGRSSK